MNLILTDNHSSLWNLGKHLAVLEKIECLTRRRRMLAWKLEISHLRQTLFLLPSPALRHAVGVFISLDHSQVTLKIWGQNQLFFHRSDYWGDPVCFFSVASSPLPPHIPISICTNITQGYCLLNVLLLHRKGFGNSLSLCSSFLDRT